MPAKNRVKTYVQNSYYHIYNSGIDNKIVFRDDSDYWFFLNLLKTYLSPLTTLEEESRNSIFKSERPYKRKRRALMNLTQDVTLLAYCLSPTRFQLFIRQSASDGITKFMRRVVTSYVTYFNKRHQRSGHLFQGVYKAALILDKEKIVETIDHIHLEPVSVRKMGLISTSFGSAADYPFSSYHHYLSKSGPVWLDRSDLERLRSDL